MSDPKQLSALDPAWPRLGSSALETSLKPPPIRFWLVTAVLFSIACIGRERWQLVWQWLPEPVRAHFTPSDDPEAVFHAVLASVFLWGLAWLLFRNRGPLGRTLSGALKRQDFRYALYVAAVLMTLSLVTRPSSLGVEYEQISLDPFGQQTFGLSRRLLEVVLAYALHLNGPLFIVLHFGLVLLLIALVQAFLRRQGVETSLIELVSLCTSAFVFYNFQYPGYPDCLVVVFALILLLGDFDAEGYVLLIVLALLAHDALAVGIMVPLALWLPKRLWPWLALPYVIYGALWALDFGGDVGAGFRLQINYAGHSGPTEVIKAPLVILTGILAANKLLWIMVAGLLVSTALRHGAIGVFRVALPALAAIGLCVLSYDTSRMAGVGFATLLLAWSASAISWPARARHALVVLNLVVPSVYVSPYFDHPFGIIWTPGLYSAYHGFRVDTVP